MGCGLGAAADGRLQHAIRFAGIYFFKLAVYREFLMRLIFGAKLLLAVAASLTIAGCGKLEYDYKGLGFANEAEMNDAFSQGYHTKVKLEKMRAKPEVVHIPAPQTPASPVVTEAPAEVPATPAVAAEEKQIAPSFDCAKASTDIERMICSDNKLAKLDSDLSAGYKMTYNSAKADDQFRIKIEQRTWLKNIRNICKDKTCIANAYEDRVHELTGD